MTSPMRISLLLALAVLTLSACKTTIPAEAYRQRGNVAWDKGDWYGAGENYRNVVDRYPGDWEAQYRYGVCMLEIGHLSEARKSLEIAITRRPENTTVADALAETMYQQGDVDRLFAFLRERTAKTQTVDAYRRLGKYAMASDDPDTARTAFDTAIVLDDGQSTDPYLDAAGLAERIGDLDEAVRRLRQAYGIKPEDDRVVVGLRRLGEIPGPTIALPPGS